MNEAEEINKPKQELVHSKIAGILFRLYQIRRFRKLCFSLVHRLENGEFYSATLRKILANYHGVQIGAYSYGECMIPGRFPSGVVVGRYVSIGPDVKIFLRNHPLERLSMHPFFYNSALGYVEKDTIGSHGLEICHDSWIGANAVVTPGCSRIGIGAVIGAGAIVTKDVSDFAVVIGNPGKQVRLRFDERMCELILKSRWWEKPVSECAEYISQMIKPLDENASNHPLLKHP